MKETEKFEIRGIMDALAELTQEAKDLIEELKKHHVQFVTADLCDAPEWHIYSGIDRLAEACGQKADLDEDHYKQYKQTEYCFDYRGIHAFELGGTEREEVYDDDEE